MRRLVIAAFMLLILYCAYSARRIVLTERALADCCKRVHALELELYGTPIKARGRIEAKHESTDD